MKNYYIDATTENVIAAIRDNYTPAELAEAMEDREAFAARLNDELWADDAVTGNGSGSYTFNRAVAEEIVKAHLSEVVDALQGFGSLAELGDRIESGDWEYLDVTARCYYLGQAIENALDELS